MPGSCHPLGNRNGVGMSAHWKAFPADKLCRRELAGPASRGLAVPRKTGQSVPGCLLDAGDLLLLLWFAFVGFFFSQGRVKLSHFEDPLLWLRGPTEIPCHLKSVNCVLGMEKGEGKNPSRSDNTPLAKYFKGCF